MAIETTKGKLGSPGLLAMAVFSVMVDDIRKELNNMPKHVLPASRVMACGRVKGAGNSMAAWTPRIKTHPSKMREGAAMAKSTAMEGTDLLLAPVAAAFKEISGKRVAPLISDKYNPMSDLHNYVNTPDSGKPRQTTPERDPFFALMSAIRSFEGPKAPDALKKYDPTSSIGQIKVEGDTSHPDPLITFIKAARAFNGLTASERLAKYDPLSELTKIPVAERDDGEEYSLLHAMLRAAPEQGEGPDHSLIKALLNAEVDMSPSRFDLWKAAVGVNLPEIDVEKSFPILGDIMARLRENSRAQITASAGTAGRQSTSEDEVAEAEQRADEAERRASALLERIERKEDELLSKVQQLKTRFEDDD